MNFKQKVHAVSQVAANIRYIQANTLKIKMQAQDINFRHQERFPICLVVVGKGVILAGDNRCANRRNFRVGRKHIHNGCPFFETEKFF
jgi:hypothetical protein